MHLRCIGWLRNGFKDRMAAGYTHPGIRTGNDIIPWITLE